MDEYSKGTSISYEYFHHLKIDAKAEGYFFGPTLDVRPVRPVRGQWHWNCTLIRAAILSQRS